MMNKRLARTMRAHIVDDFSEYTVQQYAQRMNVTEQTVRSWIRRNLIDAYMVSRKTGWRILTPPSIRYFNKIQSNQS